MVVVEEERWCRGCGCEVGIVVGRDVMVCGLAAPRTGAEGYEYGVDERAKVKEPNKGAEGHDYAVDGRANERM